MSPTEIATVERTVGVHLPSAYRLALETSVLTGDEDDHPEFITDAQLLIRVNKHFSLDPDDLSELRAPGILGALKFFLLYGSSERVLARRRKWHEAWVKGQRFAIGSDLGEEQYYIVLSESSPNVYCHELETQCSRKVASSLSEWPTEVKRRQREAESEA
jgi:hypothetical protein